MTEDRTGRALTPRGEDSEVTPVEGGDQRGVERFSAGPRAHTVALTEERSAQIVKQSGSARNVAFLAVLIVALFIPIYWFYDIGVPALGVGGREVAAAKDQQVTDISQGYALFIANCARCHGGDAKGTPLAPPLWGEKSFSIGASMAREERAAAFIKHNMPLDRPGTLTDAQAWDVAAYVTSLPRTDLPGKELDYPNGKTPRDTPYRTKSGFTPTKTVVVYPRSRPSDALVPLSATARKR